LPPVGEKHKVKAPGSTALQSTVIWEAEFTYTTEYSTVLVALAAGAVAMHSLDVK